MQPDSPQPRARPFPWREHVRSHQPSHKYVCGAKGFSSGAKAQLQCAFNVGAPDPNRDKCRSDPRKAFMKQKCQLDTPYNLAETGRSSASRTFSVSTCGVNGFWRKEIPSSSVPSCAITL